ncbi:serine/threonine protein phosphatase [Alicyclobacillus mali]|uniref:Serine/threonine protein phosphatase n=1 Tax=Alicyclobacillus mali (ex Roth et al. 2021) TaxID=1123961 RepID=A0ABS0F017_9BACL|nr:metallophosphoesterase family protein [Alicyclobacillus mali (ex Roth et al. 2021)]MBF8376634.1 serine/threonine protein phosphatase [Alicyclobacillus mali (ex Roth et al. 2021)]
MQSASPERTIFISDIHGHLRPFLRLLAKLEYRPGRDQLVLVGDYISGGPDSLGVLHLVHQLCGQGAVALRGNHEDAVAHWMRGGMKALGPVRDKLYRSIAADATLAAFLPTLPYAWEGDRWIAVHAGIDPDKPDWRQTSKRDLLTIRERFYARPHRAGKRVVFGHTPCMVLHGTHDVWYGSDKVGIDGGARHGGQVNALVDAGGALTSTAEPV